MKLRDLYRHAVEIGMAHDWRGREALDGVLERARAEANSPGFDADRLWNPYGDTRIAWGDPDREVTTVLVAIDMTPTEILLAGLLRERGVPVDCCISHHPSCINRALFHFDDIVRIHAAALREVGVDAAEADAVVEPWVADVRYETRRQTVTTARQLDMALMSIHTPADLMHVERTRRTFAAMADRSLGEIADALNRVPELASTPHQDVTVHGDADALPGTVYNPTGAGWRPLLPVFETACRAGADTAVLVSPDANYFDMARTHGVAVVELPHDANDNHGLNLMLDALCEIEPLRVIDAGEFARVER